MTQQEQEEEARREREEELRREQERLMPSYEFHDASFMPIDAETMNRGVKLGHWGSVSQSIIANRDDFSGHLLYEPLSKEGDPVSLEGLPYSATHGRPIALPKAQLKTFPVLFFTPRFTNPKSRFVHIDFELQDRGHFQRALAPQVIGTAMRNYQYNFVILSRENNRYHYLKSLPFVTAPSSLITERGGFDHPYTIIQPEVKQRIALPTQSLAWTNIAVLLWDDIPPDALSLPQQQAMVDWLHWGGTLIVSGPRSLDSLKSSFLAEHLPALASGSAPLSTDSPPWHALHAPWQDLLTQNPSSSDQPEETSPIASEDAPDSEERLGSSNPPEGLRPIDAVALELFGSGTWIPNTGQLVAERSVGRGRIVTTSFALADPKIRAWELIDPFFSNCLLRHPARRWQSSMHAVGWEQSDLYHRHDSRLISNTRYFTRDTFNDEAIAMQPPTNQLSVQFELRPPLEIPPPAEWSTDTPEHLFAGYRNDLQSGVAGWNDKSGASDAARRALREAAGIDVPSLRFVFSIVSIYLIILVPLNWLFFRLIGRVEWAWAAAPGIAILGGFTVIHLAQINIGFAQSRTDIAVLELQSNYGRGHLTRYTALYTSLSTSFNIAFDDSDALALPFSIDSSTTPDNLKRHDEVHIERAEGMQLRGLQIISNASGALHSEQMIDCAGGLHLTGDGRITTIVNQTEFDLRGTGLIRRTEAGIIEIAWIGDLPAGASLPVTFLPPRDKNRIFPEWEEASETAHEAEPGALSIRPLLDVAEHPSRIKKGETSLLAWTNLPLPGMEIEPVIKQHVSLTLVIAHLKYAPYGPFEKDLNMPQQDRYLEEVLP